MNSITGLDGTQELLIKLLEQNPDDWGMRKKVVWFLYEAGYFREASRVIWNAPEIPAVDKEIVFAARVVSKGQPARAMRLLNAVVERNRAEPTKNLEMAKELVKGGMPLQAARFYGAATLSDNTLIDEEFEICLITTDAEEDDWSEVVQGDEFPWDGPVELSEKDLACDGDDVDRQLEDDMLSGLTQPVPLKAPVKSMQETMVDEEKAVDLRKDHKPLPLNPDKISTRAVTMSVRIKDEMESEVEDIEEETQDDDALVPEQNIEEKPDDVEISSEDEKVADDEEVEDSIDDTQLTNGTSLVLVSPEEIDEDINAEEELANPDQTEDLDESFDDELEDTTEPVAAKKGMFSSLMGFFRRSKNKGATGQTDAEIFDTPETPAPAAMVKPSIQAFSKPEPISQFGGNKPISITGPVKPKPVPMPSELQGSGGRKYGQPEAIDCRTRLVALAPQDGSMFFNELSEHYAKLSNAKSHPPVAIAREEAGVDYLDLIEKACSNDKSVSLDSFSKLLGLHASMTEADCVEWIEDMNLLRQGFGDAVLATVVSKYSVSECRDILGAVYRKVATKAAV